MISRYLVEIFPGEEGLVAGVGLQQGGEGAGLLALLPGFAAAVALQRVVGDPVVVRVLPRQDAGSAGAAQRAGHKLQQQQRRLEKAAPSLLALNHHRGEGDETHRVCEGHPCIADQLFCLYKWSLGGGNGESKKLQDVRFIMKMALMLIHEQESGYK